MADAAPIVVGEVDDGLEPHELAPAYLAKLRRDDGCCPECLAEHGTKDCCWYQRWIARGRGLAAERSREGKVPSLPR